MNRPRKANTEALDAAMRRQFAARRETSEAHAYDRLRLMYGMTDIRQDPDNGTWWVGSPTRPDLLNLETLAAAARYLDAMSDSEIERLTRPRGSDSEPARKEG